METMIRLIQGGLRPQPNLTFCPTSCLTFFENGGG